MFDFLDIFFVQQLLNGLSVGLVYALVAIGFTLIFGVLNVGNFAHGEIYMLGAYAGLVVIATGAPPFFAVILAAAAAGAFLGFGLERLAFKPFRRFRDEASLKSKAVRESTLLSSLAVSIVVREVTEKVAGADMQIVPGIGPHLEQPRRIARARRPQGDPFGWQVEIEIGNKHGRALARGAAGGNCGGWRGIRGGAT